MLRIAIVDDHELFLKGLQNLLNSVEGYTCETIFTHGNPLIEALPLKDVDILLLDLQLPDYDPLKLLKEIRKRDTQIKILYLTLIRGNRYFNKLDQGLFEGYLLKDSPLEVLKEAIETVSKGEKYYGDRYGETNINTVTFPSQKLAQVLSKREAEVLKLIAQEFSNADIAEKLFLSVSTVDSHRKNLLIKLGVENTVGLVKVAIKNGII